MIDESELEHLAKWSKTSGYEAEREVRVTLFEPKTPETEERIRNFASLFGIRFLESTGLDYVYDGEANRIEMYEHPVRNS
jgi:hypothetical protein